MIEGRVRWDGRKGDQGVREPQDRQDDIDAAAAAWAARLGGDPLGAAERRALDRWLQASAAHAAAFDEARSAWVRMGALRFAPGALAKDIVPPRRARPSRRWLPAAIAACLLLAVLGTVYWAGDPAVLLAADHRTAPGERRLVTLVDGSTVELGPASAIAVRFGDGGRKVALLAGVAYFTAAPRAGAESRPFIVEAANGAARALGTQFMVERLAEAVEVTVAEHTVAVALDGADGRRPEVVLAPGQSVRYAKAGIGPVRTAGLDRATAWRRDRLIFDSVPLREVVSELNRYRRGRIVIADAALASRTVSGVFETHDPDAALATIARELGMRAAAIPPLVTLLY